MSGAHAARSGSRETRPRPHVRAAKPEDLSRIWELLRALAEYERWTEYVTGSETELGQALFGARPALEGLVAEHGGRVVGYALFYPTYSSFRCRPMIWLEDLFVEESSRGIGAGVALLAELARIAVERKCLRVDWHVLDWNRPSIEFYERAGATRQGVESLQYGLTEEALRALAGAREPRG
jgi:GNAT superfamily N-acetyltransferase